MADFLRVFEAKALASALTEAGYSVSERTVQRWKAGHTRPKPQDIRAIRELIGVLAQTEEAPPPEWAEGLAARVADQVVERVTTRLALPLDPEKVAESVAARLGLPQSPAVEDAPVDRGASPGGVGIKRSPKA